jgi:hypothetical protein
VELAGGSERSNTDVLARVIVKVADRQGERLVADPQRTGRGLRKLSASVACQY